MKPLSPNRFLCLSAAVIVLAAVALYWPLLTHYGLTDQDALANIGHLRAAGGGLGWPNGFFFISAAIRAVNGLVNATGGRLNDYLLAYRAVIWGCLTGAALGVCWLAACYAGRRNLAVLIGLVYLTLPGEVRLFSVFEDNLISALAHLIYLAAYLRLVAGGGPTPDRPEAGLPRRWFLYGLFPLTLLLAVLAHRQFAVLWPTPLLLFWFLRNQSWRRRWILVLATYGIAGGGFLAAFAALTWYWDGALSLGGLLGHLNEWFFPVPVYRQYYFFNQFGWSFGHQAGQVFLGVSRLFACAIALPGLSIAVWAGLGGWLLWQNRTRRVLTDPLNQALALFVMVHVPHSLVYESSNVERWDSLLVPLMVLLGRLTCQPWKQASGRAAPARILAILWALILFANLPGCAVFAGKMLQADRDPLLAGLRPRLALNVLPDPGHDQSRRLLLVLSRAEFDAWFMLAEAFYSHADALWILGADGRLYVNDDCYPVNLKPLDPARRQRMLQDRRVIASPAVVAILRRTEGLAAERFLILPPPSTPQPSS